MSLTAPPTVGSRAGRVGVPDDNGVRDRSVDVHLAHLDLHQRRESAEGRLIGGPQTVEHQPKDDGVGPVDDVVPEGESNPLATDGVGIILKCGNAFAERLLQPGAGPLRREGGDLGSDKKSGLEDAACDSGIKLSTGKQQAGEQVETGMPPIVADRGGIPLAHLDKPGLCYSLKGLPHGGAGNAKDFGQLPLTGQRLSGRELPTDDVIEDLVEHLIGDGPSSHRLKRHTTDVLAIGAKVKWSDHSVEVGGLGRWAGLGEVVREVGRRGRWAGLAGVGFGRWAREGWRRGRRVDISDEVPGRAGRTAAEARGARAGARGLGLPEGARRAGRQGNG
jgi:hypothetical protein